MCVCVYVCACDYVCVCECMYVCVCVCVGFSKWCVYLAMRLWAFGDLGFKFVCVYVYASALWV